MQFILKILGELLDAIIGPSQTITHLGFVGHATETIDTVWLGRHQIGIVSKQYVYCTIYKRWFIPNRRRAVYEVTSRVPDEIRDLVDPKLFDTVTYPTLCISLLRWTKYPHLYAIIAYLDRIHPGRARNEIKLDF